MASQRCCGPEEERQVACVRQFIDLNEACPKDNFPFPRINQIVDATTSYELLSFLDAFFEYNQIPMYSPDAEKTTFITSRGLFCYDVMLFSLKNAGATYQRLVTKIFRPLLGRNTKGYIDNMLMKSKLRQNHLQDLAEAFAILHRYGMMLNQEKCVFGV